MWNAAEAARMSEAKSMMDKAANCRRAKAPVAAADYERRAAEKVREAAASFAARVGADA